MNKNHTDTKMKINNFNVAYNKMNAHKLNELSRQLTAVRRASQNIYDEVLSRGTPVGPSGREMGVGQKGHLGG